LPAGLASSPRWSGSEAMADDLDATTALRPGGRFGVTEWLRVYPHRASLERLGYALTAPLSLMQSASGVRNLWPHL